MFHRHRARGGAPPPNLHHQRPPPPQQQQQRQVRQQNIGDEEDGDEDDVFSAMSRRAQQKAKAKKNPDLTVQPMHGDNETTTTNNKEESSSSFTTVVASTTSSMKRHHKELSQGRKAKMDAVLQELQLEQQHESHDATAAPHDHRAPKKSKISSLSSSLSSATVVTAAAPQTQPAEPAQSLPPPGTRKGGSHVEPGEEHLTTNIFVGNLAPNLTEEALQQVFGQFGELYSVKIMWPRTAEERARQRLTGFVCFYRRQDAEDAMEACNEADPFRNGRRLMLRWGKSVLKDKLPSTPLVVVRPLLAKVQSRRIEGIHTAAAETDPTVSQVSLTESIELQKTQNKIQVTIPSDPIRARLISLVASFVANDGADLEHRLFDESTRNLSFLSPHSGTLEEHVFYKWRVYAYTQGDGPFIWRTEPFVMVKNGCLWIPPPVDPEAAARQEEEERRQQEEQQRQRRRPLRRTEIKQQRHQTQRPLAPEELQEFHYLTRLQLCASREAIAQAMAFCFEKSSHSAPEIANLLKELLLLPTENGSVEPLIARLYLLSDVLFNSQQPGVRNAFYYRDAIQQMAPEVFASLGVTVNSAGRLTQSKMSKAVTNVLAAWTNWSVYNHTFLYELQARFEGKDISAIKALKDENDHNPTEDNDPLAKEERQREKEAQDVAAQVASTVPRGDWKEVEDSDDHQKEEVLVTNTTVYQHYRGKNSNQRVPVEELKQQGTGFETKEGHTRGLENSNIDDAAVPEENNDDDVDGEPIQDRLDEAMDDSGPNHRLTEVSMNVRTASLKTDHNTQESSGEHFGGCIEDSLAPLDSTNDGNDTADGEEDLDGEPLEADGMGDDEDADGEPLAEQDDEDVDGEPL